MTFSILSFLYPSANNRAFELEGSGNCSQKGNFYKAGSLSIDQANQDDRSLEFKRTGKHWLYLPVQVDGIVYHCGAMINDCKQLKAKYSIYIQQEEAEYIEFPW